MDSHERRMRYLKKCHERVQLRKAGFIREADGITHRHQDPNALQYPKDHWNQPAHKRAPKKTKYVYLTEGEIRSLNSDPKLAVRQHIESRAKARHKKDV